MPRKSLPPKAPRRRGEPQREAGAAGHRARPPRLPPPGNARRPRRPPAAPPPFAAERVHERELVPICGLAAVRALFAHDARRVERLFFEPRLASELVSARRLLAKAHKPYREAEADE